MAFFETKVEVEYWHGRMESDGFGTVQHTVVQIYMFLIINLLRVDGEPLFLDSASLTIIGHSFPAS